MASSPTRTAPSAVKATMDGVVLLPYSFAKISRLPSTKTPTQEVVVPRSMPTATHCDLRAAAPPAEPSAAAARLLCLTMDARDEGPVVPD